MGCVDVAFRDLRAREAEVERATAVLTPEELARAARFRFERDRRRFIIGRATLRTLLAEHLGIQPTHVLIQTDAAGKPKLAAKQSESLQFNISHSGELIAVALAELVPLGIDIEEIRPEVDIELIASQFMTAEERAIFGANGPRAFFQIWTAKEAILKASGSGLSRDPLTLSILVNDTVWHATNAEDRDWRLIELDCPATHVGFLAVPDARTRSSYDTFSPGPATATRE